MVLYLELYILNTLSNYTLILVGMRFTSIWRSMLMLVSIKDLVFCKPVMQPCAITCCDDKVIKVWNVTTGSTLYIFEGHDAPVHSVCPHNKQNVHFFFSTSVNGKIKAWLYHNMGYRVDYDAPDHSITTMAFGADGKRLVYHTFHAGQVKMENLMLLNGMKMMV